MSEASCACAVCRSAENSRGMSKVVIEGRALSLCRAHAATVAAAMPATYDEMRALFVGADADVDALMLRDGSSERRSPIERRAVEDRRVFPPRPEGRRKSAGRRTSDPREL